MAEELAPAEGEPVGVDALTVEDAPVVKTVEDFARERGWKPKDEYSGEDWRDAENFLSFGIDRNKDLLKSLRSVEDRVERISRTSVKIAEDAADKARREERQRWENTHARAVEEGDLGTAQEAVQKIAELANPAPNDPTQRDPLVERFVTENAWFNSDPVARAVALQTSELNKHRPVAEQLEAAKEAVHKRFPEYAPAVPKPAPTLNQPGSRVATPVSRAKTFGDLPRDAQEVANMLVKKGLSTREGYVRHYFNEGAA